MSAPLACLGFLPQSCTTYSLCEQKITIPQENAWSHSTTIPWRLQPLYMVISAVKHLQLCHLCLFRFLVYMDVLEIHFNAYGLVYISFS